MKTATRTKALVFLAAAAAVNFVGAVALLLAGYPAVAALFAAAGLIWAGNYKLAARRLVWRGGGRS